MKDKLGAGKCTEEQRLVERLSQIAESISKFYCNPIAFHRLERGCPKTSVLDNDWYYYVLSEVITTRTGVFMIFGREFCFNKIETRRPLFCVGVRTDKRGSRYVVLHVWCRMLPISGVTEQIHQYAQEINADTVVRIFNFSD